MNAIFKKLNFKEQKQIYVLQAPDSFKSDLLEMQELTTVKTNLTAAKVIEFAIAFVTKQSEVDQFANKLTSLAAGDVILWFAYPKGTSKKYKCEFNRDNGWKELGKAGYEPVRMVAIDEDWSALRFRNAEHIKKMVRDFAISKAGKAKVAAKNSADKRN